MAEKSAETLPLKFVFTEDGFSRDFQGRLSEADQDLRAQFEADRWTALYHMGLAVRREELSPSAAFLYQLSAAFFRALTSLPDLELSRENAKAPLTETDRLLRAVVDLSIQKGKILARVQGSRKTPCKENDSYYFADSL